MHHILLSFVDIDKSVDGFFVNICCRTPCGVRGLKFRLADLKDMNVQSHPLRGAWIEIAKNVALGSYDFVAPPAGCVD